MTHLALGSDPSGRTHRGRVRRPMRGSLALCSVDDPTVVQGVGPAVGHGPDPYSDLRNHVAANGCDTKEQHRSHQDLVPYGVSRTRPSMKGTGIGPPILARGLRNPNLEVRAFGGSGKH